MMTVSTFLDYLASEGVDVSAAREAIATDGRGFIPVAWNARLRTRAGVATLTRTPNGIRPKRIQLNPRLREEGIAAIAATFMHELAHALTCEGHTWKWQTVARHLGGDAAATRLHYFASMVKLRRTIARKVIAACSCGWVWKRARLSKRYAHALAAGHLTCPRCKSGLRAES